MKRGAAAFLKIFLKAQESHKRPLPLHRDREEMDSRIRNAAHKRKGKDPTAKKKSITVSQLRVRSTGRPLGDSQIRQKLRNSVVGS